MGIYIYICVRGACLAWLARRVSNCGRCLTYKATMRHVPLSRHWQFFLCPNTYIYILLSIHPFHHSIPLHRCMPVLQYAVRMPGSLCSTHTWQCTQYAYMAVYAVRIHGSICGTRTWQHTAMQHAWPPWSSFPS